MHRKIYFESSDLTEKMLEMGLKEGINMSITNLENILKSLSEK